MVNVYTHIRPDADAFGTALAAAVHHRGTAWFLAEDWGERPASIRVILEEFKLPEGTVKFFQDGDPAPEGDAIVVDCGDPTRVSAPAAVKACGFKESYDHHCNAPVAWKSFGSKKYPSASSVYWDNSTARDLRDDGDLVSSLLFAGLVGDTEAFSNSATTPLAFRIASEMANCGAAVGLVVNAVRKMSLSRARLQARYLASLRQFSVKDTVVNAAVLLDKDFEESDASRRDYAGMPSLGLMVGGADLSVSLIHDSKEEDLWHIAFRSTPESNLKAKDMAILFGGNGHENAAGGKIRADDPEQVLRLVIDRIGQNA